MAVLVLALGLLLALVGLGVRMAHRLFSPRFAVALGLLVLAAAALAEAVPEARAPVTGAVIVAGAALSRDVAERIELAWLVVVGLLLGLALYAGGALTLAGAALAFLAVWLVQGGIGRTESRGRRGVRVKAYRRHLLVCVDGPCKQRGALALRQALGRDRRFRLQYGVRVTPSGCLGHCGAGPIVWAEPEGTLYRHVEASTLDGLLGDTRADGGAPE